MKFELTEEQLRFIVHNVRTDTTPSTGSDYAILMAESIMHKSPSSYMELEVLWAELPESLENLRKEIDRRNKRSEIRTLELRIETLKKELDLG